MLFSSGIVNFMSVIQLHLFNMKRLKNPYISPESELYIIAMEECILSGNGRAVVFGNDYRPGADPDEYDEGAY